MAPNKEVRLILKDNNIEFNEEAEFNEFITELKYKGVKHLNISGQNQRIPFVLDPNAYDGIHIKYTDNEGNKKEINGMLGTILALGPTNLPDDEATNLQTITKTCKQKLLEMKFREEVPVTRERSATMSSADPSATMSSKTVQEPFRERLKTMGGSKKKKRRRKVTKRRRRKVTKRRKKRNK
jgi:hypothetical protein